MSVSAISSANSIMYQQPTGGVKNPQAVFDGNIMKRALKSGNLDVAKQAYDALTAATNGGPFSNPQLAQDYQALGQQLAAGDVSGAQQAFAQMKQDYATLHTINQITPPAPVPSSANTGAASASGIDVQA